MISRHELWENAIYSNVAEGQPKINTDIWEQNKYGYNELT